MRFGPDTLAVIEQPACGRTPAQVVYVTASARTIHGACIGDHQAPRPWDLDRSGRIAPMRTPAQLAELERQATALGRNNQPWARLVEPWDPWPASRIGYDAPSAEREADPRLPARPALEALRTYLHRMLGERCA